ncbi:hypothetical protein GW950_00545 [Candidatus Wolfebacteria bacterium]|nr:hypothetical protein [Candidatus Wolfebacteria bacterium]
MIEQFPKKEESNKNKKEENTNPETHEDLKIKNDIEREIIKMSGENPLLWIKENGKKFGDFFADNKEMLENLYKKNPNEAIALTKKVIESEDEKPASDKSN